jgi:hypothetical protein
MALYLTQGETIPEWQSFSLASRQQVIRLLAQAALHYVRPLGEQALVVEANDASQDHARPSGASGDCLCAPIDFEAGA